MCKTFLKFPIPCEKICTCILKSPFVQSMSLSVGTEVLHGAVHTIRLNTKTSTTLQPFPQENTIKPEKTSKAHIEDYHT